MFIYFDFIILFYHTNIDFEFSSEISNLGPLDPRKWLLENIFICLWLAQASKSLNLFLKNSHNTSVKNLRYDQECVLYMLFYKIFYSKMFAFNPIMWQHSHQTFILGKNVREKLILEKRSLFWRQLHKSVKMLLQKKGSHDFIFIAEK